MQMVLFKSQRPEVEITHKGESLIWNVAAFAKENFKEEFDMFHYNNLWWAKMKPEQQDRVFEIFKSIRYEFENENNRSNLTQMLFKLIAELYDKHHNLDDIKKWMLLDTDIRFPPDLHVEYIASNERSGSRDQTYLRDDYAKLVCLTFALRLMIPIWGEYISRTKHETGTEFKEYYAFHLIVDSHLYTSEAMEKLRTYVYCSIPDEKSKSSIIGGISSEDFPKWVLALVVIRKLCTCDISGHAVNYSLIPYIYNHVRERVKRSDNNFAGIVKDKIVEGGGSDEQNKSSKLEGYKMKQEVAPGDIVLLEYFMENIRENALMLCPDLDMDLLESALKTCKVLETQPLQECQIAIAQWVFKPVISSRALLLLSKACLVRILAATQAILWHNKHYAIAGLVTAMVVKEDDEFHLSGVDSRARITKDLVEELSKLFPYSRKSNNKIKLAKNTNQAIASIDYICELLSERTWNLTIPQSMLQGLTNSSSIRRYSIPHDIKIKMATLVVELAKRPRVTYQQTLNNLV